VSQVTERLAAMRAEGLECGEPLTQGRTCVHVRGHDSREVPKVLRSRHSHSWENYSRGVVQIGNRLVDTATGEVVDELASFEPFGGRTRDYRPSESEAKKILGNSSPLQGTPVLKSLAPDYHGRNDYWCPHVASDMWTCKRCNYGLERLDGVTVPVASPQVPVSEDIVWHFKGKHVYMGTDPEGRDFEKDVKTGSVTRVYSINDRREAVALADEYGLSAAARKTGIPRSTLQNWKRRPA
jgi:hypothetical protein